MLAVLLATEPVSPLSEHLGEILDRGPKREYYLAWGIFQVMVAKWRLASSSVSPNLYTSTAVVLVVILKTVVDNVKIL